MLVEQQRRDCQHPDRVPQPQPEERNLCHQEDHEKHVQPRREPQGRPDSQPLGHAVKPIGPVKLQVLQGVENVETRHP